MLSSCQNVQVQEGAVAVLGNISTTDAGREVIINKKGTLPIASLLFSNPPNSLCFLALDTLSHLSIHPNFCRVIQTADLLSVLVDMLNSGSPSDIIIQSLKVLTCIVQNHEEVLSYLENHHVGLLVRLDTLVKSHNEFVAQAASSFCQAFDKSRSQTSTTLPTPSTKSSILQTQLSTHPSRTMPTIPISVESSNTIDRIITWDPQSSLIKNEAIMNMSHSMKMKTLKKEFQPIINPKRPPLITHSSVPSSSPWRRNTPQLSFRNSKICK